MKALYLAPAMLAGTAAFAQATGGQGGAQAVRLETVTVTARRVTENVQTVPLTVNVLSSTDIADKGITQTSGLTAMVPNLIWSDAGGGTFQNRITLRGIYSNATSQGFDPGVAIYVDDVYVGNQFGFNSDLLDIERIEVLKGPQGTLFGRNTAAGAISTHTTKPSTTGFYADGDLRVGNYGLFEERAVVNIPLSGAVALKLSGIANDRDGYQKNVLDGKHDLNDEHYHGGRAQLLWTPTDNLDLLGTVEYFKEADHQDIYSCASSGATGELPCPNARRSAALNNDIAADNGTRTSREMTDGSLKADWRPGGGGVAVTSITAYRKLQVNEDQDQDYTAVNFLRSGYIIPKDNQFSEEARVASPQDERLRGVGGIYYYNEDRVTDIPSIFTADAIAAVRSLFGFPPTTIPGDFLQSTNSELKTSSWAVFGQGQFDIVHDLTLEGGLRYTEEHKRFDYAQTENPVIAAIPAPFVSQQYLIGFPEGTATGDFSKATPEGSLRWTLSNNAQTYVRYAKGFKAGGFQAATNSPNYNPLVPFGPENSEQYEIGLKTEWLQKRLIFNTALFLTNYDDIQVQITDPITHQKVVGNYGSARSKGGEIESSAVLFEGMTVSANLGVVSSRFVSGSLVGRTFQYVPHTTGALTATYVHPVWDGWDGMATATAAYRSTFNLNTAPSTSPIFLASPGVTTINARIGVEQDGGIWAFYLWGDNLTDARRFTNFTPPSLPLPASYHITPPRTFGIEVRAHIR